MSALVWLLPIWLLMALAWAWWLLRPVRGPGVLPPQRRRAVPWGGAEVLVALILAMWLWPSLVAEALSASGFLAHVYGPDFQAEFARGALKGNDASRLSFWLNDLSTPLSLLSILAVFHVLSDTRPYQLGLTASRWGRNVVLGVTTTICVVPPVYLILYVVSQLQKRWIEVAPEEHPIQRLIQAHPPPIDLVVSGIAALVAAPFLEEFLFRGIIQPWVRTRRWGGYAALAGALFLAVARRGAGLQSGWTEHGWHGVWPELLPAAFVLVMTPGYLLVRARAPAAVGAVYATSLLFAAAHSFAWPSPVPLFFFALALGAVKYRTQSLLPSVVTHAMFNSLGWLMLFVPTADKPEKDKEVPDARARVEWVSAAGTTGRSEPRGWAPGIVPPRRGLA
jgi:membrane protease YdiL (CAAX protease family)